MNAENLLDAVPDDLRQEAATMLHRGGGLRIERIVSLGHASPPGFWYDQEEDEWVLLLEGIAVVEFEGREPVELRRGSYLNIPAHVKHRVAWTHPTQKTIWLAIHYGAEP